MTGRHVRVASVLAVAALSGLAAAGPVAARAPALRVAAAPPYPLAVTITAMTPVSAANGATLTLRGSVRNTSPTAVASLSLLVGVGTAPATRAGLLRDFGNPVRMTRVLDDCRTCLPAATLGPGASEQFAVSTPLGDQLDRGIVSVYPLAVRVLGDATGSGEGSVTLGEADTVLPYVQQQIAAPLRVSWLVPLDAAPVQDATGAIDDPAFPGSLAPTGPLGAALAATTAPAGTRAVGGQPGYAPVTYAVEPGLLEAASQTARPGWHRAGDAAGSPPRPAATVSGAFLTTLAAATRGAGVLALPYADPDAVALARAGLGLDLSTAVATGASDLSALLPAATVLTGVGWLPGDAVDQPTLTAYASAGVTTLVLPSGQLAVPDNAFPPTQSAVTTLPTTGPTVRGLVTDPDLEVLLAAAGHDQPTPAMAAQRLLAVLALTVGEAPNDASSRDVVLALPRSAVPTAGWLHAVLADTGSVPWLRAVRLGDTADDPPGMRTPLAPYPPAARSAELPQSALTGRPDGVTTVRAGLAALGSALPDFALTRPLQRALDRSESYAWRTDPAGSAALRDGVAAATAALLGRIQLAAAGTVTLASQNASIPVTVENALPEPATVRISLESNDRTKLATTGVTVTVPAGRKERVLLRASTQRAGTFRASITMATPSGRLIDRTPFLVHSRAYGSVTVLITLGALAVLLLAIVVRTLRRVRRRPEPGG